MTNRNDLLRFKLTARGFYIHRTYWHALFMEDGRGIVYAMPVVGRGLDADGFMTLARWQVTAIFGAARHDGGPPVFQAPPTMSPYKPLPAKLLADPGY